MVSRPKRRAKTMECKRERVSLKRKRTGKKTEHTRMQHIMIRPKAVGKQTKPKMLCGRIKHIRKGEMMARMRMTYESIEQGSAE